MYFLLDETFRRQTLIVLRRNGNNPGGRPKLWPVTGSQSEGKLGDENVATNTADLGLVKTGLGQNFELECKNIY